MVLDFGFSERGFFDDGPHHGFRAAIERTVHHEFLDFANDDGFAGGRHRHVGVVPFARSTKALELTALDVQPVVCELAALLAELNERHLVLVFAGLAILFFDFPFDG